MEENLNFFLKQMQQSQKALDILKNQMLGVESFLNGATNTLTGEEQQAIVKLKLGINRAFEKAKKGDMSFNEDLKNIQEELKKYDKNGGNSNG